MHPGLSSALPCGGSEVNGLALQYYCSGLAKVNGHLTHGNTDINITVVL